MTTANSIITNITELEAKVLAIVAYHDDFETQMMDDFSETGVEDLYEVAGGKHQAAGVMSSLTQKDLIWIDAEYQIIYLTDLGKCAHYSRKMGA